MGRRTSRSPAARSSKKSTSSRSTSTSIPDRRSSAVTKYREALSGRDLVVPLCLERRDLGEMLLLVAVHGRVRVVEDDVLGGARIEPVEVVVEPALGYLGGEEVARRDGRVDRDGGDRGEERLVPRLSDEDLTLGGRAIRIAAQICVVKVRRERDRSVHERERERAHQHGPHESSAQHRAVGKRGETEDRGAERERDYGRAVR